MCRCEDMKMIDRPPLLEEPFAQTLSVPSVVCNNHSSYRFPLLEINRLSLFETSAAALCATTGAMTCLMLLSNLILHDWEIVKGG